MLKVLLVLFQLQFLNAPVVASNSKQQIPFSRMDAREKSNRKYNLANNGPSFRFRAEWRRSEGREDLLNDGDHNVKSSSSVDDYQKTLPSSWLQLSDFIPSYIMLPKPGRSDKKRSFNSHSSNRRRVLRSRWFLWSQCQNPW